MNGRIEHVQAKAESRAQSQSEILRAGGEFGAEAESGDGLFAIHSAGGERKRLAREEALVVAARERKRQRQLGIDGAVDWLANADGESLGAASNIQGGKGLFNHRRVAIFKSDLE